MYFPDFHKKPKKCMQPVLVDSTISQVTDVWKTVLPSKIRIVQKLYSFMHGTFYCTHSEETSSLAVPGWVWCSGIQTICSHSRTWSRGLDLNWTTSHQTRAVSPMVSASSESRPTFIVYQRHIRRDAREPDSHFIHLKNIFMTKEIV